MPRLTADLLDAYEQLDNAQQQFSQRLLESAPRYWFLGPAESDISLPQACQRITGIWYQAQGDGRRTENLYGLIGVDPGLIPLIRQLNQIKQRFQQAVRRFRDKHGEPTPLLYQRACELNQKLQDSGLARLHLKQCYRQLPLLEKRPDKVTFSWYCSGRSLKKLTVAEAEQRLLKMDTGNTHIQIQLAALGRIPQSEPLVQIQQQVPVMRANIAWKSGEQWLRKARNCPLPVFFPLDATEPFPEYNVPPPTPPEQRKRQLRNDLAIEPEPYLPSLRIHRYRRP
ncbi:DNA replication terminus site-binding protein [Neptuniibacter halophilus]|uniref:DNA replication terminus site-binding protein n=1 Tax=Neptuniibacter halophilus TaxID=651666 RepID=UPI002573929D|nr:DNA replication terminus site-binding protein [Neptuniibacter halophilus]